MYDGDGRVSEEIGADGSITHYEYDPDTGELADTWVDNNGDGSFEAATDSRQRQTYSPATSNDAAYAGSTDINDNTSGDQSDSSGTRNGGLDTQDVEDGEVTTSHTTIGTGGNDTTTTSNPDGSTTVDSYHDGLLTEEDGYDDADTLIAKSTYEYDDLARNTLVHQFQANPSNPSAGLSVELTTQYKYRPDDSIYETDNPDGTVDSSTVDPLTGVATSITTPDGTISQGVNARGQITSQTGGGVIPVTYDYNATGQVSGVHLFNSTDVAGSTPQENISYGYDPASGLLSSKGYGNDGPGFHYSYNSKDQLTGTSVTGAGNESSAVNSTLTYDAGGQLTQDQIDDNSTDQTSGSRFTDGYTYDNQGNLTSATETVGDQSGNVSTAVSDVYTYDPTTGNLASEVQGEGIAADYHYYGPQDSQSGQEPGALKDLSFDQNGTGVGSQSYTYDSAGRVQSMTLSGLETFTYSYLPGTDLIQSETVSTPTSGNALYTAYSYDSNNRLQSIDSNGTTGGTTTSGGTSLYDAAYTYQTDGLRASETVDQRALSGSTLSHAWNFGYDDQQQLTSVTNASDSSTAYSYAYDKLGNQISSALGAVNGFNEYANVSYNDRGDVTDDGSFSYSWDAKDRLIGVISDASGTNTKETFSYDANDRISAEDTFILDSNGNWQHAAPSYRFIYDNQGRIVEVAQSDNTVYTQFAWGPDGKLAGVIRHSGSTTMTFAAVADANGNITELKLLSSGQIFSARVDAYGNVISTDNAITSLFISPFAFGGLMRDQYSGIYFAAQNVYDPRIAKWLHNDPTAENGGWNTGDYCLNDPINLVDPQGTSPQPNWSMSLNLTDGEGYAQSDPKALAAGIAELQARADFHYNNANNLYGQSSTNVAADQKAYDYYTSQLELWKNQYNQIAGEANVSSADIYAYASAQAIGGAAGEMGAKVADFVNDVLYLQSMGTQGSSNLNLSQVSQLQATGQTTAASATLAAVPFAGSGYNMATGTDLMTGQKLDTVGQVSAGFAFASDVLLATAGGKALIDGAAAAPKWDLSGYDLNGTSVGKVPPIENIARGPIQAGEVTTFQDFVDRSVVGDNLEGHELWQHANLKAQGLATERLSTPASQENPIIALDQSIHRQVNAAQRIRCHRSSPA